MNLLHSHKLSILLLLFSCMLVHASTSRTYVSVNGSDGNTGAGCPATAPCRSFGAALGVTDPYGEIVAVDSGDYAPVTITKSVTMKAAPGVDATILAPWEAITVTIGTYDSVVISGLTLNGLNMGSNGIRLTGGGELSIENCSILQLWNNGISIEGPGSVYIRNTKVQNTVTAIRLQSPSGMIHASIDHVHVQHNSYTGLFAGENSQTTIRESVFADNAYYGIQAGDYVGATELNVDDCVIQGGSNGIFSGSGGGGGVAVVRVSHSTIVDNSTGISSMGGALLSYGNNRLAGNGTDGSFTGLISLQ
jgi:Right handed beta helix region